MNGTPIKRVVIAGGGSAGWMTAAALSKFCGRAGISVTLVESEAIGTVGVGEATIPPIGKFNDHLGIKEDDFVRETQATYKLGIEFVGWGAAEERYFHPFGTYGFDLEGMDFHQYWQRGRDLGEDHSLDDYSLNALCAYGGKFLRPEADHGPVINKLAYAFHFDAGLYAAFLRRLAEARGVTRVEGRIEHVERDPESGLITALALDNTQRIEGDLFVDCTGFRAMLIEGEFEAGFEDWSHWLPVNRAVAVACRREGDPEPYTRSTARSAGWQWRIPLQHRTGNGHVYCDAHMSAEQAEEQLVTSLEGEALTSPNHLRFQTGHRKHFWEGNCVAIGLSSGFLEPLESTSLHLIQSGIAKLISLFPHHAEAAVEREEYNRLMRDDFEHIRDFLILHYKATRREGQPFWDYVRTMPVPGTLTQKMDLLRGSGRFFKYDAELFDLTSWLAVAEGQGWGPEAYNPVADALSENDLRQSLANMRRTLAKACGAMPTHQAFIDRYCKAPPAEWAR
ncbi:tryptophan halogenase family protein [Qipengyuania sp. DGS5-3]|uniref:tryptophan halogenase family protein n=1 Tax=Qipengyuania sp. DGS5-3 TaxID=3349632 RepID=UPI0036D2BEB2